MKKSNNDNGNNNILYIYDKYYRYISEGEYEIIIQFTEGHIPNLDAGGKTKYIHLISEKYESSELIEVLGLDLPYRIETGAQNVNAIIDSNPIEAVNSRKTESENSNQIEDHEKAERKKLLEENVLSIFPELIEIHVLDTKLKPISGIALDLRLFANRKNDYNFITDMSNVNGVIIVTKDMLTKEIENSKVLFTMDYASNLNDCKPYIELSADDGKSIKKRLDWATKVATVFEPAKRGAEILKKCKNDKGKNSNVIVNIEKNSIKQIVVFEIA